MSKLRTIIRETEINKPIEEVFGFFCKAENLNLITPPSLNFKIFTPLPIEMKKGTIIEYKIKLNGISFKWKTEITEWNPPHSFLDRQLKGPYRVWIHEHLFSSKGNATIMKDIVQYLPPGWFLEPVINKLMVKKKLEHILDYRQNKIKAIFK
ncbi:MAG: SRPBCC family protein [Ignavibacteria bacterium]